MQQAIDYEVRWQIELIEDGGAVAAGDRAVRPRHGETRAMRTKEDAHDYRYFPDPDLPPLVIAPEWIERVRARDAGAAARDGASASCSDYGAAGLRRGDADAEPGDRRLLRGRGARPAAQPKLAAQLDHGRGRRGA